MKVLTIGNGFVSEHLSYPKIDVRLVFDASQISNILDIHKPDVLINCIGKTGTPNVDWCESNKEVTASTNVALPLLLAEACAKKSIHLVNIGSGCIYFGESPNVLMLKTGSLDHPTRIIDTGWKETDFANPKSFYSKSKYACDLMLGEMSHVSTLRIRMPISTKNSARNLINKLKNYKQIINIPNSVTFMDDLAECIDWVAKNSKTGTFHVTNPEPLTAVQVMTEYQKYVPDHTFEVINEQQLDTLTVAKRSNCVLNTDKLKTSGFTMTSSLDALQECMAEYVKNI